MMARCRTSEQGRRRELNRLANQVYRDLAAEALVQGDSWAGGQITETHRYLVAVLEALEGIAERLHA